MAATRALDPLQASALGGGITGLLGGMFRPDFKNPADVASPFLDKIPDELKKYFEPYIGAGQQVMPDIQQRYKDLLNDPASLIKKLGSGYQESPGYQFGLKQAEGAATNAAAAGGMLGSPQAQQNAAQIAANMSNEDFERYLNHVLGAYGQGLGGEEGLMKQGFGASGDLATSLANLMAMKAGLAYKGQEAKNQYEAQGAEDIFGGLGSIASLVGSFL